jgi:short-subunit dehydrogenase involved in D-alanine esterification of teichoic acids
MKVAITGHTSGIGLGLYEHFKIDNHVIGLSRSTGHDITNHEHRLKIIESVKDCDIIVNNAYHDYDDSQLEMLKMMVDSTENAILINISSRYTIDSNKYCQTKLNLDRYCESLIFNRRVKLINIKPGLIDTPRVKNINNPKMEVEDVVNIVKFALANIDKYTIHSICFGK